MIQKNESKSTKNQITFKDKRQMNSPVVIYFMERS